MICPAEPPGSPWNPTSISGTWSSWEIRPWNAAATQRQTGILSVFGNLKEYRASWKDEHFPCHTEMTDIQYWECGNCTIFSVKRSLMACFPQVCQRYSDLRGIEFLQICGEKRHPATGMRCRQKRKAIGVAALRHPYFCMCIHTIPEIKQEVMKGMF